MGIVIITKRFLFWNLFVTVLTDNYGLMNLTKAKEFISEHSKMVDNNCQYCFYPLK